MALEIHQVALLVVVMRMKEMVEADFEQRCQRRVGGNVAANARVVLVLAHHHGHGVPTDQALDPPFHGAVARIGHLIFRTNGVDVGAIQRARRCGPVPMGRFGQLLEKVRGTVRTRLIDDLLERLYPFRGFPRIEIHSSLVQFLVHRYSHYNDVGTMSL